MSKINLLFLISGVLLALVLPSLADEVRVTPEAARAAGLPPLTIRSVKPEGWSAAVTPDATTWLSMSSPPGGPAGLDVRLGSVEAAPPTDARRGSTEVLDIVGAQRSSEDFSSGSFGEVKLGDVTWSVETWAVGQGPAREAHLALWRRMEGGLLVVDAYWGAKSAPPADLKALPKELAQAVNGLKFEAP
jgi:hypothetical protein